jgi:hypothetical protein
MHKGGRVTAEERIISGFYLYFNVILDAGFKI